MVVNEIKRGNDLAVVILCSVTSPIFHTIHTIHTIHLVAVSHANTCLLLPLISLQAGAPVAPQMVQSRSASALPRPVGNVAQRRPRSVPFPLHSHPQQAVTTVSQSDTSVMAYTQHAHHASS